MATDAVPARASSDSIVEAWWFRFLVRIALALLAFWMLSFASDRYFAFLRGSVPPDFRFEDSLWLSWVGATVAAGFLFGLATWLPFVMVRYLPSRLLLAALALLPLAHFWILQGGYAGSSGWLARFYWFDGVMTQFVLAALAGVALASGLRPRHERATSF